MTNPTFVALVTPEGTAMGETALCWRCCKDVNNRVKAVDRAAGHEDQRRGFVDTSENEAMSKALRPRTFGMSNWM